jgi:hypothetical protein
LFRGGLDPADAQLAQNINRHAIALARQPQQQVFRSDVVMANLCASSTASSITRLVRG